jgi:hypothetical protein
MAILLFVHIKLPPLGELTKSVTSTWSPPQTDKSAGSFTVGVGLTATVNCIAGLTQPFTVAVAAIVPTILFPVKFVAGAVKFGTFPLPIAPKPMVVVLFVQLKRVLVGVEMKPGTVTIAPGQTV